MINNYKKKLALVFTLLMANLCWVTGQTTNSDLCKNCAKTYIVQDVDGYNSWPMIQALGNKLVCVYSRGTAHDIGQDARAVYARTSTDNGRTWTEETVVANTLGYGESAIGKGLDGNGNMLLWVRRIGKEWNHDLYRSKDGVKFERIATLRPSPMPMQITDVFVVPKVGLMALWFGENYTERKDKSWGTLVSRDNGKTWEQHIVESGLGKDEWPTEPSAVYLGKGRILAIARTELGDDNKEKSQFQMTSTDYEKTWQKAKTNINDILASTPSLVFDTKTGLLSNYYFYRGKGLLKRRIVNPNVVFNNPKAWPEPELVAKGSASTWDAGNANATAMKGMHYIAFYSGKDPDTSILVSAVAAPTKKGR